MTNIVSRNIENQFPSFMKNDGELFISFLKSYYEWLECVQIKVSNIDTLFLISDQFIGGEESLAKAKIKYIDYESSTLYVDMLTVTKFKLNETLFFSNSISNLELVPTISYTTWNKKKKYFKIEIADNGNLSDFTVTNPITKIIISDTKHSGTFEIIGKSGRYLYINRLSGIGNIYVSGYTDPLNDPVIGRTVSKIDNSIGVIPAVSIVTNVYSLQTNEIIYNPVIAINSQLEMYDIDQTIDSFISHFKNTLAVNIPESALTNKRLLYKHIKEFYLNRGNIHSYKFLFNILYGLESDVISNNDKLLRPSDNTFKKYKIIRVDDAYHKDISFKGRTIVGESSGATALVEYELSYVKNGLFLKDIYVNIKGIDGVFLVGEKIYDKDDITQYSYIHKCLNSVNLLNGGSQYSVGDVVKLTDTNGVVIGKVASIKKGSIKNIIPINGGSGYVDGTEVIFDNTGCYISNQFKTAKAYVNVTAGVITSITMQDYGIGYIKNPTISVSTGSSATFEIIGNNIGTISKINVTNNQINDSHSISTTQLFVESTNGTGVIANVDSSNYVCLFDSSGELKNNKGFLSDDIHIIDSEYWQPLSYLVKVGVVINKWRDIIKRLVHPAGTKMYGLFNVRTRFLNELEKKIYIS